MQVLHKHIFSTLLAIFLFGVSYAQDFQFTAGISHHTVKTGDRFQIEFKGTGEFTNFKAPQLGNFRVLSGPNQSTNMSWVNGKTSSSISLSVILISAGSSAF